VQSRIVRPLPESLLDLLAGFGVLAVARQQVGQRQARGNIFRLLPQDLPVLLSRGRRLALPGQRLSQADPRRQIIRRLGDVLAP
jgi:hypothetical protein